MFRFREIGSGHNPRIRMFLFPSRSLRLLALRHKEKLVPGCDYEMTWTDVNGFGLTLAISLPQPGTVRKYLESVGCGAFTFWEGYAQDKLMLLNYVTPNGRQGRMIWDHKGKIVEYVDNEKQGEWETMDDIKLAWASVDDDQADHETDFAHGRNE